MSDSSHDLVEQLSAMSTRQLVRWLATPAQSGFFLSPDDVRRLGRDLEVSVTPFGRANGLEQLLRGAALDGRLKQALGALREEMTAHLARYEELDLPELAGWVERASAVLDAWSIIEGAFREDEPTASSG